MYKIEKQNFSINWNIPKMSTIAITGNIINAIYKIEDVFIKIQRGIKNYRDGYSIFDFREGYPY